MFARCDACGAIRQHPVCHMQINAGRRMRSADGYISPHLAQTKSRRHVVAEVAQKETPAGRRMCESGISLCTKPHGTGAFVSEVPFCLARKKERPQSRTAPRARVTNYEVVGERPSRSLSKITIIGADAPCLQRIRRSAKTERSYFTVPFPNMYIGPPSVQASFLRSDLYIQYLPRPFRRTASASLVLAIISDR